MRALGDPDVFLGSDLGVKKSVAELTESAPAGDWADVVAACSPWRSYLTHLLSSSTPRRNTDIANDRIEMTDDETDSTPPTILEEGTRPMTSQHTIQQQTTTISTTTTGPDQTASISGPLELPIASVPVYSTVLDSELGPMLATSDGIHLTGVYLDVSEATIQRLCRAFGVEPTPNDELGESPPARPPSWGSAIGRRANSST